ncbi:alpha/beta hydrolase [Thermoleptolyngbya oregonensis NK1-22]|uniref:Alpha/beta hydrolase n=1 Tax=Thermoleptolyngbya oregonensis NK1-22 TaxID=2547457 RepID=A0AA97BMR1_9CYAN|nr:alpha/beta hydrolase [Thermoleptolyngbya oregonensis NK1-22]
MPLLPLHARRFFTRHAAPGVENLPAKTERPAPADRWRDVPSVPLSAPLERFTPSDRWRSPLGWVGGALLLVGSLADPAAAAKKLSIKLGPVQSSVQLSDLQHYAKTGDVQGSLRGYRLLLSPSLQSTLQSSIPLDPNAGHRLVKDLLSSSAGDRLLTALERVIPNGDRKMLQLALTRAATHTNGLSLLGFLQEFPAPEVVLDLTAVASLTSQMNLAYWQSQALTSILERELTVPEAAPFHAELDPTRPGTHWVRQQSLVFRDYERARTIPVDLYWSYRTTGPLIVISHGFGADRRFLGYLARHLASYGFAVAALEHPGSNVAWITEITQGRTRGRHGTDLLPSQEFIDRPHDISFLLSELDRLNRHSTLLRGRLDTQQVVVIGHSLGGYTALALAGARLDLPNLRQFCNSPERVALSIADWLQCTAADLPDELPDLRDRRVARVMLLNPVIGRLFDEESLAKIRIPTLIVSGTSDAVMPAVSQQLLPFTQLPADSKLLLTVIGGGHLSVGDPENLNQALTHSLFMREQGDRETEALRQLLKGISLSFVKQLTPDARHYKPFLSAEYVQSFSTATLQLRLNAQLSEKLSNWLQMAALPLEQMTSSAQPQPRQYVRTQVAGTGITVLLAGLPLVVFVLPGYLSSSVNRVLRRKGQPGRANLSGQSQSEHSQPGHSQPGQSHRLHSERADGELTDRPAHAGIADADSKDLEEADRS